MTFLKYSTLFFLILLCLVIAGCESTTAPPKSAPPIPKVQAGDDIVVIETDFGKVKIQLFPDVAPNHVAAFKKRVSEGFYNGLAFHRAVPNLIVQGGDPNTKDKPRETWGGGDASLPKIKAEFNTRPFVKGTLGAARATDPDSASTQFFICVEPFPQWDGQYTNFGQVIEGLSNVQVMTMAPTDERETLKEKIVMKKVYLEKYAGK